MAEGSKTGGRQAGTPNRRTTEQVAAIDASGLSPLDYLVTLYRDVTADPKDRALAAKAAAPYLHPRPAPVQRTIRVELPDISTVAGVSDAIAAVVQEVASGALSPAEGQAFVSMIEAQRKAIETADIMARVEALEAKAG